MASNPENNANLIDKDKIKKTFKGWEFSGTNIPLKLIEKEAKEAPSAAPGRVILEVKAAGLCHSDVSALEDPSWMNYFKKLPVILGHECAGVVIEVGEGVEDFKLGDRVGINSWDPISKVGIGYNNDGGYATRVSVPAKQCVKIPDCVSFVEGAAATDAGNTAYHALFTAGGAKEGMKIGIIGIGGLGQFAVQMAIIKGCEVYGSDISNDAIKLGEELGCKEVYKSVLEMKKAECDIIIDFAGFGTTTADAVIAVKQKGKVVVVGMGKSFSTINTAIMIMKEVTVIGNKGGTIEDLKGVYECFKTGKMKPKLTIIKFEEIPEGLKKLKNGQVKGRLVAEINN